MREIDPGHDYMLRILDSMGEEPLTFVKREGPGYPSNRGHHPGTTVQEVLRACCSRLRYVNNQGRQLEQPECKYSEKALGLLQEAIRLLEVRAARRHGRNFAMTVEEAEFAPTCKKCGHVGCEGACHE